MPDKKLTEGTTALDYEGTLKNLTKEYYDALDLSNRLQAENEKLRIENGLLITEQEFHKKGISVTALKLKAEAYKEFADKLKFIMYPSVKLEYEDIDKLLKELVGEDNG